MSYIELTYFKLQQPAANHTATLFYDRPEFLNIKILSYAETNIPFRMVFVSYCSL